MGRRNAPSHPALTCDRVSAPPLTAITESLSADGNCPVAYLECHHYFAALQH